MTYFHRVGGAWPPHPLDPLLPSPTKKLELLMEDLGTSGKTLPRIPPNNLELLMGNLGTSCKSLP